MKKLITISLVILFIIGFGVFESIVSQKTYNEILGYANELEVALNTSEKDISKDDNVVRIYEQMDEKWNNFKLFALALANHNQIKEFSQKLSMLKGYIVENDKKESIVTLYMLKSQTEYLIREFMFNYENIL